MITELYVLNGSAEAIKTAIQKAEKSKDDRIRKVYEEKGMEDKVIYHVAGATVVFNYIYYNMKKSTKLRITAQTSDDSFRARSVLESITGVKIE